MTAPPHKMQWVGSGISAGLICVIWRSLSSIIIPYNKAKHNPVIVTIVSIKEDTGAAGAKTPNPLLTLSAY